MKKRTLLAVGTILGASAFALFKSSQGKGIQKHLREKVGKITEKANNDEILMIEESRDKA